LGFVLLACCLALVSSQYTPPQKAGFDISDCLCKLDPRINATTLNGYNNGTYIKQIAKFLWASACGRSRGVFTLLGEEYVGNTYSCAHFPPNWGINAISDWFKSPDQYKQQLHYLDLYLQGNYNTTANKQPNTCDFVTMTLLDCGPTRYQPWRMTPWVNRIGNKPFRGVNAGGVFVLEPWITPKLTSWTLAMPDQYTYSQQNPVGSSGYQTLVDHWTNWYTPQDFQAMKSYGLNAIRLPVGWWYWAADAGISPDPYTVPQQNIRDLTHPITQFIKMANASGLVVILDLHGAPGSQNGLDNSGKRSTNPNPNQWGWHWFYDPTNQQNTIQVLVSMSNYITFLAQNGIDNVIALELLNEPWVFGDMAVIRDFYFRAIQTIRQTSQISIVIHDAFRHSEWEWLLTNWPFKNTFMDTHIYHAFNSDDIASSTPNCDHNKMIVAQNIACGYGSMLRFKTCTSLPTLVGEWSIAIDDCMTDLRGAQSSVQFIDFGQCKHLTQRIGDKWWIQHYQNFALKQMSMAERELGWFFWTYKTGPGTETDPSTPYWSYSAAVAATIIPNTLPDLAIQQACYQFEDTEPYTC
jgi:glucan 1,3-beta-glucosidase